jgi:GT2 family glycosyltransferase
MKLLILMVLILLATVFACLGIYKNKQHVIGFLKNYPNILNILFRLNRKIKRIHDARLIKILNELSNNRDQAIVEKSALHNGAQFNYPEIDISIVVCNSSKWMMNFFSSLFQQDYPCEKINLFIADNASSDDTVELINSILADRPGVFKSVGIFQRKNLGFGSSHDFLIRHGKSKYILVTNVDLEFESSAILNVIKCAESSQTKIASWELRQKPYEHPKYYDPVTLNTPWSSHASILMLRDAYLEVGGYEKKIFMYGEDVELSYRFRVYGYNLKYVPSAVVWHYSYEDEKIKPLQYKGSLLANAYIRMRYGSIMSILAIPFLYAYLFLLPPVFENSKKTLLKNIFIILMNTPYFLLTRKNKNKHNLSIFKFDYAINREGSSYRSVKSDCSKLVSIITRTIPERPFEYLERAILCVANQTYSNIELIIAEDGGNTHEQKIMDLCKKVGVRYIYIPLPKKGRTVSGNAALAKANGDYVLFFDDDDLLFADHIETLATQLYNNQSQYVACYSLAWSTAIDKTLMNICQSPVMASRINQPYNYNKLMENNYIPIQSIIFKKELFNERGGFDESLEYYEDWNLWLRYGYKNEFMFIPKVTSIFTLPADQNEIQKRQKLYEVDRNRALENSKKSISAL